MRVGNQPDVNRDGVDLPRGGPRAVRSPAVAWVAPQSSRRPNHLARSTVTCTFVIRPSGPTSNSSIHSCSSASLTVRPFTGTTSPRRLNIRTKTCVACNASSSESRRLAALAHAINNTSATAASSTSRLSRTSRTWNGATPRRAGGRRRAFLGAQPGTTVTLESQRRAAGGCTRPCGAAATWPPGSPRARASIRHAQSAAARVRRERCTFWCIKCIKFGGEQLWAKPLFR